jgi:valyl-tRNA synthetase
MTDPKPLNLPRRYDAKETEPRWQKFWEDEGVFKYDPSSPAEVYSVDTPPPTVSGALHIGHIFSYTQADIIIHFWKMTGRNVYYPFGFDDNGLATERLVERAKKVQAPTLPRPDFVKMCLEVSKDAEREFKALWQSIGLCCDWNENYTTINPHCQFTSQLSFLKLYEQGHIFRQMAPTLWCPHCRTAIAQAEVEDKDFPSHFSDVTFAVEGVGSVTIATTRPELLPACVAVLVNPFDERNKHLVGKTAVTPLFGQRVPVIEDGKVDPEKGTGVVMCCTFGDTTDIEWWQKYALPLRICIDAQGKLNELAGGFAGLGLVKGREAIIRTLKDKGLVTAQRDITHTVNTHERCGTPLEFLVNAQWFIRILDKKDLFLKAAEELNWYPKFMHVRYQHWVQNLAWDWCISRQRFYGVPFPLWYCKGCGEVKLASKDELPVDPTVTMPKTPCSKCGGSEFDGEKDVMDTWMTSSMTPQINAHWGVDDARFAKLYPMTLRPQAHDIIRTWAFYTIVKGVLLHGKVPWRDIMISGHALDPVGKKMSKHLGNVVTPAPLIEKYTADVVRYWCSSAKLGTDTAFSEEVLANGKRLVTKIFNASKLAITHLTDFSPSDHDLDLLIEPVDRWVMAKAHACVDACTKAFREYEFSDARVIAESFFWGVFCDNYLELVKGRLYSPDVYGEGRRTSAQVALYRILLAVLKLFAPHMPHVTEEVYSWYFAKTEGVKSLHLTRWPEDEEFVLDEDAERVGDLVVEVLAAVRKFKSEANLSIKKPIAVLSVAGNTSRTDLVPPDREKLGAESVESCTRYQYRKALLVLQEGEVDLLSTTNARRIVYAENPEPGSTLSPSGNFYVGIEMAADEKPAEG